MKNNSINTILLILILVLVGYIVYDKVLSDNNKEVIQNETTNNNVELKDENNNIAEENKQEDTDTTTNNTKSEEENIEIYENIIETNLLKLLGNKKLSEISNQDKLAMIFEMYKNEYGWKKEISKSDLNNVKENSILKNLDIEYTSLNDYSMTTNHNASKLYELNNKNYTYQNIGHKSNNIKIIHKELIDSNFDNNDIKLSYNFVFSKTEAKGASTTPGYHYLYYSYEDINNNKHFKDFSFMDINEEIGNALAYDNAKNYIDDNYKDIKDKLYTYTFVFSNEENNIILKDYYRE